MREVGQRLLLCAVGLTRTLLRQALSRSRASGARCLGLLGVDGRAPALGGQQEVVDAARRGPRPDRRPSRAIGERMVLGDVVEPGLLVDLARAEQGAAGADQGVAAAQVQAEPGGLQALAHGVEPQRDLGQFDGGGVEVDAVDLVQREVGLDLLQPPRVVVGVDPVAELVLALREVAARRAGGPPRCANAPEPSAGSQIGQVEDLRARDGVVGRPGRGVRRGPARR